MEQRILIEYLRKEDHGSTQIHSKLVEHYGIRYFPILISANWCGSFAWGEKVMKIRGAAENCQISKLISESREHLKHRPMLQFETLLRLPELLRQGYSMFSLKFFIWNFVTEDGSTIN
jgi:hypothetical protein